MRFAKFGALVVGACAVLSALADEPGLVAYRFAGRGSYLGMPEESVVTNFAQVIDRRKPETVMYGTIDVPEDGDYTFAAKNREMLRFDGCDLELAEGKKLVSRTVRLAKGRHRFERWINNTVYFRQAETRLRWALPGTTNLVAVPDAAFRHSVADCGRKVFYVSDPEMRLEAEASSLVRWKIDVKKAGYYRLSVRRAGSARWGDMTPADSTEVWIDGEQVRHFYTELEFAGFLDDETVVRWYEPGEHTIEMRGTCAWKYRLREPRLWMTPLDAVKGARQTFGVTQTLKAETVFRLGEPVDWIVSRSTLDCTAPYAVDVVVVPQRGTRPVWTGKAVLPPGQARAEAQVSFPRDLAGAFEYSFVADGETLEGPWEFLVVDVTPPKREKLAAGAKLPALESLGRQVDAIDFGTEELEKGPHRVRDNGTSHIVKEGALAYRVSGARRKGVQYCNLGARDGSLPVPLTRGPKGEYVAADGGSTKRGLQGHRSAADWFAATLHLEHPRVAHVAAVHLPNDVFRRFPVQLIDTMTGRSNGAYYEILAAEKPGTVKMLIPFWPNATTIDLVLMPSDTHNDPRSTPGACAKVELYECPDGFPAMPEAAGGWNPSRRAGWDGEQGDLSPERSSIPPLWDDGHFTPAMLPPRAKRDYFYDFTAYNLAWQRFGEYSAWQGNNFLQWPVHSYGMAHVQTERLPWGNAIFANGEGFRPIDKYRRNSLKIILLACEKYGIDFWGDIQLNHNVGKDLAAGLTFDEIYAGGRRDAAGKTVKPAVSTELFRTIVMAEKVKDFNDLVGCFLVEDNRLGGNMNPAHPIGRRYMVGFYGDIARQCRDLPAFKGMNIRQWNSCSSMASCWWSSSLSGYDDWTLGVFAKETGVKCPAPVRTIEERQRYFHTNEVARVAWFQWRADKVTSLRAEILAEMRKYRPDATLRTSVQEQFAPVVEQGMGLDRRQLTREMGFNLNEGSIRRQGNEMCALDAVTFDGLDVRPEVTHTNTPLEIVRNGTRYLHGLCTAAAMFAPPYTTKGFAEAMAAAPMDLAYYGQYWAYPAGNELLREWLRAFRAVPDGRYELVGEGPELSEVVCRRAGDVAYFVSLRPYPIRVELPEESEDLVRGGKVKTLELAPYGLRLVRTPTPIATYRRVSSAPKAGLMARLFGGGGGKPDKTARAHVDVTVENASGEPGRGVLCTFKAGELTRRGFDTGDVKLFRDGVEVPLQLDRCDARGRYQPARPGQPLEKTDEFCFLADFAAGEKTAKFVLAVGGRAPKAFPVPFATSPFVSAEKRPVTNYTLKVTSGKLEVGLFAGGIGPVKYDGKWAYRGMRGPGSVGWTILGGVYETRSDKGPVFASEDPVRVISQGPVRLLAGFDFGAPRTRYQHPHRHPYAYPAFVDCTLQRVYQFTAGSATVAIANRYAYAEGQQSDLTFGSYHEGSLSNPSFPSDGKRMYAPGRDGKPTAYPWRADAKSRTGGEFRTPSSTWFGFWDDREACGFAAAMDPTYANMGGFGFGYYLTMSMANTHMDKRGGRFDFRLAFTAYGDDPKADGVSDWARGAFAAPPAVVLGEAVPAF